MRCYRTPYRITPHILYSPASIYHSELLPIFHLDFMNDRLLIAAIAILHILINHALAVGFIPLVTYMEWLGFKNNDERWDRLALQNYVCRFCAY